MGGGSLGPGDGAVGKLGHVAEIKIHKRPPRPPQAVLMQRPSVCADNSQAPKS